MKGSGPMPMALGAVLVHLLLVGASPALAAQDAPSPSKPVAAITTNVPPAGIASPEVLYEADAPPRTDYDTVQELHTLTPESKGLVAQLGRTVLSMFFVVALIYLTVKILLPKFINRLPQRGASAHLKLIERLQLDAAHQIFLVDVHEGPRVLLGTGASGVQMLQSWSRPDDAFRGRMLKTPNPLPDNKDDAHAPN